MRLLLGLVVLSGAQALAQELEAGMTADAGVALESTATDAGSLGKPVAAEAPALAGAKPVVQAAPPSARARLLGRFGFGFLGTVPVLQAAEDVPPMFPGGPAAPFSRVSVPMLGVRWWTPLERLGVELGVGAMVSASASDLPVANGSDVMSGPTTVELALHLSAPIVLGSTEHTIVFVAPELRVGRSTLSTGDTRPPLLAMTWSAGLKAGVELFFSFIGLTNLSLEAGVRAGFTHEVRFFTVQGPLGGPPREGTRSESRFSTSLVANPWDLFTGTLAARYYF